MRLSEPTETRQIIEVAAVVACESSVGMVLVELTEPIEVVSVVVEGPVTDEDSVIVVVPVVVEDPLTPADSFIVVDGSVRPGGVVDGMGFSDPASLLTQMELFVYDLIHSSKAATRV